MAGHIGSTTTRLRPTSIDGCRGRTALRNTAADAVVAAVVAAARAAAATAAALREGGLRNDQEYDERS
jgi:hypothetical protein